MVKYGQRERRFDKVELTDADIDAFVSLPIEERNERQDELAKGLRQTTIIWDSWPWWKRAYVRVGARVRELWQYEVSPYMGWGLRTIIAGLVILVIAKLVL